VKKIALVGLYSIPNMGDQILCDVTHYLIRDICGSDAEIVPVDVCPRYKEDYKGLEYIKYRISRKMKTIGERNFEYKNSSKFRYRYEYFYWWLRLNRYYRKILKGVDAIVFAGGGFLKFRTQGLNYYVEQIVKIASKRKIPVMMNGVGVEGFDLNDIRCRNLRKVVNSDCVKVITTRDDIQTVREGYVTNPSIKTDRVGDPALWIPECYHVQRSSSPEKIGINVIRGKVYQDYGNKSSPDELTEFYMKLIRTAQDKKMDWVLFSNGMKGDQKFGIELLEKMDLPVEGNLLPAPKRPEDLIEMIRGFKGVFGARLHACITAYSLGVPVVGLIWNEKARFFAEITNKSSLFFEEGEMDPEKILDRLNESLSEKDDQATRDRLKGKTRAYLSDFLQSL
jgi:polysaccharide pyruvyl transferase WcaK-like protein